MVEYVGGLAVVLGVLKQFWPVWLGLLIVLIPSFMYKKRLGLYGQLFDSGAEINKILKSREIYRHLKNSADRIDRAADDISVIVIKRS